MSKIENLPTFWIVADDGQQTQPAFHLDYNELPPTRENVEVYSEGENDETAIDEFLRIGSTDQLADLAAQLYSNQDGIEPEELVERAAEIRFHAERRQWLERVYLLTEMNRQTLQSLAIRLNIEDVETMHTHASRLKQNDPIAGPVVQCLLARHRWVNDWVSDGLSLAGELELDYHREFEAFFKVADQELAITAAEERTSLSRPKLDAELIVALRWATNEREKLDEFLIGAFLDHLALTPCEPFAFKPIAAFFGDGAEKNELNENANSHRELEQYRDNFKPGKEAPDLAITISDLAFSQYWESLMSDQKLAWLATHFFKHWTKHKSAYLRSPSDTKKLALDRKLAAKAKHAKAVKDKFMSFIESFFEKASDTTIQGDRESREDYFLQFSKETAGIKQKLRQHEVVDLFELLHSESDLDLHEMLEALRISGVERFNALAEHEKEDRRGKMKPSNRSLLDKGGIPENLRTNFSNMTEEGLEACINLWNSKRKRASG